MATAMSREQLEPGKTITALATGADPQLGQFDIEATDFDVTLDNAVAAINDAVFASGVIAVKNELVLELTASTNDVNFELTKTETIPDSLLIDGFDNGHIAERYLEYDRFYKGLDSRPPTTPSNPELIRRKYKSNAFFIPESNITELLLVGYGVDRFDGIWARPTYIGTRPHVWQAPVTATTTAVKNVWKITFPNPVAKFTLEVFGRMKGLSCYVIVP